MEKEWINRAYTTRRSELWYAWRKAASRSIEHLQSTAIWIAFAGSKAANVTIHTRRDSKARRVMSKMGKRKRTCSEERCVSFGKVEEKGKRTNEKRAMRRLPLVRVVAERVGFKKSIFTISCPKDLCNWIYNLHFNTWWGTFRNSRTDTDTGGHKLTLSDSHA